MIGDDEARRLAEGAARESYSRLVAILARRTGDPAAAEDALAAAFHAALEHWPSAGVPRVPEAWLLTTARRALGHARRHAAVRSSAEATLALLAEEARDRTRPPLGDDRLELLFVCAHPAIEPAAQAPLMLQVVLGLDAARIASSFLVSPSTMSQRLVRAKKKIRDARLPFEVPEGVALAARLGAVLDAVYAAFGTGWDDLSATDPRHVGLADESIWLSRLAVALMPDAAEAKGLLALMLYCHARRDARRTADGGFVPLSDQDVGRWDRAMIAEAETLLLAAARNASPARFQVEAAIQSLHVERVVTGGAQPQALLLLYELLVRTSPSVGARVARAGAHAESGAPLRALALLDEIDGAGSYQPWWVTRGRCLRMLGEEELARIALTTAAGLTSDPAVRNFILAGVQAAVLAGGNTCVGSK